MKTEEMPGHADAAAPPPELEAALSRTENLCRHIRDRAGQALAGGANSLPSLAPGLLRP